MKSRINDIGKVLGEIKAFSCRAMGINVKILYEGIAMPTALYGAETWSMVVTEKRLNVMEMRSLKSMCRVTRRDRMRDEEVKKELVLRELSG